MSEQAPAVREALTVYAIEAPDAERVSPGYSQTEVGVIPEDWKVERLGEQATFRTGPFGSALHKSDYTVGGISLINPMHIIDGQLVPTETMTVRKNSAQQLSDFRLRADDIVIGRRGDMGRCAVVQEHQAGWICGTGSLIIRCAKNVSPNFLQRVLSSPAVIAAIEDGSVGSTMINLNQGTLGRLLIQLPPLCEQRAIASALSDVDTLISALDKLIAKKRAVKTAAMQQLLTGKQRLPGFSGEWEMRRLGDVFSFLSTANNPRSDLSEHGEIGYVHYGDLHAMASPFLDCSRAKMPHIARSRAKGISLLQEGDLIMVDASEDYEGLGKSVEVKNLNGRELVAGLHTFLLRGNSAVLADGFKGYLQYVPRVRSTLVRLATGISVYGISKNNVRSIEVSLPGIEEQTAIAAVLSDMDAEISALEARREKTRRIKQGMMQELLTGRTRLV